MPTPQIRGQRRVLPAQPKLKGLRSLSLPRLGSPNGRRGLGGRSEERKVIQLSMFCMDAPPQWPSKSRGTSGSLHWLFSLPACSVGAQALTSSVSSLTHGGVPADLFSGLSAHSSVLAPLPTDSLCSVTLLTVSLPPLRGQLHKGRCPLPDPMSSTRNNPGTYQLLHKCISTVSPKCFILKTFQTCIKRKNIKTPVSLHLDSAITNMLPHVPYLCVISFFVKPF